MASSSSIVDLHHIHFTGIKGVGMTALALCAQDLGIKVTGSDVQEIFVTDETLEKRGITWEVGFSSQNLNLHPDLLITTGAHGGLNNPEVVAARGMGIPVMTHAEALGEFAKGKSTIAVCGVGGKSTTSAMISTILDSALRNPSFAVGVGDIFSLGVPGRYDKEGKEFICEADEFAISPGVDNRPRWSYLLPKVIVVPNVEHDHPDIYPTFEDTRRVFLEFFNRIPKDGLLVACVDNENVRSLVKQTSVPLQTYGFSKDADWRIDSMEIRNQRINCTLIHMGVECKVVLNVPGRFNVLNATAAIAVGSFLGLSEEELVQGINAYTGCKRRIEKVAEKDGVIYYDDYAHYPTEINAILRALKEWYPDKRIVAVFQPHTYSRTKALFKEFAESFSDANKVVFVDVFSSARETDTLGVNSELLAEETKKYHEHVYYGGNLRDSARVIGEISKFGDIVVTLGAGDVYKMQDLLLNC
ncbi:MAG: UDP-N-acetylmuramate--L-alanine ligase [Candidatus Blackburnbacteria bacterium]|nr:UDP-N-acetylmuramate--L-alanine ligase [Candidatus Blackburnbacteria bacterium]